MNPMSDRQFRNVRNAELDREIEQELRLRELRRVGQSRSLELCPDAQGLTSLLVRFFSTMSGLFGQGSIGKVA